MPVDTAAATDRLMRFLAVEGVTGQEAAIGREHRRALKDAGVPASAIYLDDANTRIPVPTETGNLIVHLPGQGKLHNQPRIMFMTHMDTVPLCAGAKPALKGRKIVNTAKTALGGDNRTGCGVLVTLAAELAKQKPDHPPITLLFCVREESGLYGARHVNTADLGNPVMAFNYDGGSASNVVVGAVGRRSLGGGDLRPRLACGRRTRARHLVDHDPRARARRGEEGRLVRQGREGEAAGHQQCRGR
jgi:tripeptide aminopeptidase